MAHYVNARSSYFQSKLLQSSYPLCLWGLLCGAIGGAIVGGGISMASGVLNEENYKLIAFLIVFPCILGSIVGYITANLIAQSVVEYSVSLSEDVSYKTVLKSRSVHHPKPLEQTSYKREYRLGENNRYGSLNIPEPLPAINTHNSAISSSPMMLHVQAVQQLQKRALQSTKVNWL